MTQARGVPTMKPTAKARSRKFSVGVIVALVAFALFLAVAAWMIVAYAIPDEVAEVSADKRDGSMAIINAKAAIETRLPDAQNMTFGKVKVVWLGETPAVCGWVDVVEAQDAFDGVERFVYVAGQVTIEELDGSDAVKQRWDDACD